MVLKKQKKPLKAIQVAKRNNATLTIAHIVDVKHTQQQKLIAVQLLNVQIYLQKTYQKTTKTALEAGLEKIETVLEFGNPKSKISKEIAPNHKVDLIMCGATGFKSLLSVS